MFEPQLFAGDLAPIDLSQKLGQPGDIPAARPLPVDETGMPMPMMAPAPAPAPVMPPVFVPPPIKAEPKPRGGIRISPQAARMAQGIYPREMAEKQNMIDNAKMPTPTGAWGAPA